MKHGRALRGRQPLRCKGCGRRFVPDAVWRKVPDAARALIGRLLRERLSLAGVARATGESQTWIERYAGRAFRAALDPAASASPKIRDPR